MIVVLMVPIVVTVREVNAVHVGTVVRVLSGRKLPMSVIGAADVLMAIS